MDSLARPPAWPARRKGRKLWPFDFRLSPSCSELPDELVHVLQRHRPHLVMGQVADGVRELDVGMTVHALAAELVDRRDLEYLREKHRGGDPALLEFHRVVHTAQRARA